MEENNNTTVNDNNIQDFHDFVIDIEKESDIQEILKSTIEFSTQWMQVEGGFILLKDSKEDLVYLRAQKGPGDISVESLREKKDYEQFSKLFRYKKPTLLKGERKFYTDFQTQGMLVVPLIQRGNYLGMLCLYNVTEEVHISAEDKTRVAQLADRVAIMISFCRMERKTDALESIRAISPSLLAVSNLNQVLEKITEEAVRILKADFVILYEYDRTTQKLYQSPIYSGDVRVTDPLEHKKNGVEIEPNPNSLVYKMLQRDEPFYAENASKDWVEAGFYKGLPKNWINDGIVSREEVASSAGIPLKSDDETAGVLFVNYRNHTPFTTELKESIDYFAFLASLAIKNARLFSESEKYHTDVSFLNEIGTILSRNLNLRRSEILDLSYKLTINLLGESNCYIAMFDEGSGTYTFPVHHDEYDELKDAEGETLENSLTDFVRRSKQPKRVTKEDHKFLEKEAGVQLFGHDSPIWLGAPLVVRDNAIGVIVVQNYYDEEALTDHHLRLLSTIAAQTAISLENSRLFKEYQGQIREQSALYEISQQIIGESLEIRHVLETVVKHAVKLTNSHDGAILQFDHRDEKLKVVTTYLDTVLKDQVFDIGQSMSGLVYLKGESLLTNDYFFEDYKSDVLEKNAFKKIIKSVIQVPLKWNNETLGVLAIFSGKQRNQLFNSEDVRLLERFAGSASIAIGITREMTYRQAIIDTSPDAVVAIDINGRITQVNDSALKLLKYNQKSELIGMAVEKMYWGDLEEARRVLRTLNEEKEANTPIKIEANARDREGNRIPIYLTASLLYNELGELIGSYGILEDQRLLALKGRTRKLIDAISEINRGDEIQNVLDTVLLTTVPLIEATSSCIFEVDDGKATILANLGFIDDEESERRLYEMTLRMDDDDPTLWDEDPNLKLAGTTQCSLLLRMQSEQHVIGYLYFESDTPNMIRSDSDLITIISDQAAIAVNRAQLLEERRKTRDGLFATAHAVAAGQLATGFAHELKNKLNSIALGTTYISEKISSETTLSNKQDYLNRLKSIDDELTRSADLSLRLQRFGQKLAPNKKMSYINDIVNDSLLLLDPSITSKKLKTETFFDESLDRVPAKEKGQLGGTPVLVDPDQLGQVIVNILLNAIDFSRNRGRIDIFTINDKEDIKIRITDHGKGIRPEHRGDLFEPFFTTKKDGVGLGLYISRIIVDENHGGQIDYRSIPGKGASFTIIIPKDEGKKS